MIYVLPMAGHGSRFRNVGLKIPKPLIKLADQELLFHSLEGLPIASGDQLILISLKRDQVKTALESKMRIRYPKIRIEWIEIDEVTEGQLCTVLLAKPYMSTEEPLVVHNCDTSFRSNIGSLLVRDDIDGAISCFKATGPQWSYVRFDANGVALETAEKKEISNDATIGLYFFKRAGDFIREAEKIVSSKETVKGEYYIAPLYNRLIQQGMKIVLDPVISFKPIGTPQDLERYWDLKTIDVLRENRMLPTLVMDLDGTLCKTKAINQNYADVEPILPMIRRLQEFREQGFRVIISTARNMQTYNSNVGAVIANVGEITLSWLRKHDVPFDEVHFGKPWGYGVVYVDDRSVRPEEFLSKSYEDLVGMFK